MKSLFKLMSVLLAVTMLLTACGTPATPEKVVETIKETVTVKETQIVEVPAQQTVVRLSGWASSPSETALLQSLLYQFSVENPDILVKYEPITGDYKQALLTSIASGTEPDIYYVDIFWWLELATNDVLLPLDDLMSASGVKREDFIPSLVDAFTYNDKLYGIAKDFNTLGMFYNKDLFDKAGLDYPTDDWTWDDLKAAAAQLTDTSDANKPVYGFCTPPDPGRFPAFVFQNGGSVMTDDFSDTTLDSDAAIGAAEFYTSFRAEGSGALPSDLGEGWQGTLFGKGQCAMVYEGGWLIPYLRDQFPGTKYGVVMPPAGPAGEGNLIFTVAWGISANTKNPDAAWRVVNFLTSEASQKTVLESGFALPSRQSLQDSDYLKNNANSAAIFNGSFNGAHPFFWGSVGSDVNDQMGKALERIFKENQPVADAMKQAAEAVRSAMK
ncbi:MAG: ABC transporter substrate-binding protein [Chloroflexi bacterium]|nr:ABC transporter substrate-binding protein [Chloroflexota bacterium]